MDTDNNMNRVEFEGDKWKDAIPSFDDEQPRMIRLLIKFSGGAIQDRRSAEYVLFGFAVLAMLVSVFLFLRGGPNTAAPTDIDPGRAGSPSDFLP